MSLNPKVWGPHYWFVLHTISLTYPLKPNEVKDLIKDKLPDANIEIIKCQIGVLPVIKIFFRLEIKITNKKNHEEYFEKQRLSRSSH